MTPEKCVGCGKQKQQVLEKRLQRSYRGKPIKPTCKKCIISRKITYMPYQQEQENKIIPTSTTIPETILVIQKNNYFH